MNFAEYKMAVSALLFGKRLPGALYLHVCCLPHIPETLREVVEKSSAALGIAIEDGPNSGGTTSCNLLKFHLAAFKLSLLRYPDFWTNPHPALAESITVDLASGTARRQNFAPRANPPILHRKETFLPPGHPQTALFIACYK
jgi:hypothetical protein